MIGRLRCKIFGHDFRVRTVEGDEIVTYPSEWCRKCGIRKKELLSDEDKEKP